MSLNLDKICRIVKVGHRLVPPTFVIGVYSPRSVSCCFHPRSWLAVEQTLCYTQHYLHPIPIFLTNTTPIVFRWHHAQEGEKLQVVNQDWSQSVTVLPSIPLPRPCQREVWQEAGYLILSGEVQREACWNLLGQNFYPVKKEDAKPWYHWALNQRWDCLSLNFFSCEILSLHYPDCI